jgi:hypothetical protein
MTTVLRIIDVVFKKHLQIKARKEATYFFIRLMKQRDYSGMNNYKIKSTGIGYQMFCSHNELNKYEADER